MENTTQAPKGQGCVVLTHPRFDRPKVENPKLPGPKRGCLSFSKAQLKRRMLRYKTKQQTACAVAPSLNAQVARLADYVQIVFPVDSATAYRIAGVAGGEFTRQQAGGAV